MIPIFNKGQLAEKDALVYLKKQGLKLITKNYRCRLGEIDLIMSDKDHLIFVEVRCRSHACFGGGAESITLGKKQKIIKTALHYMIGLKQNDLSCRFDVISIDGGKAQITWIKNAFGTDY